MKKIVIFDMDGTLIDSGRDITVSINHVRRVVYNLEPLSQEYIVEVINRDKRNLALLFYETKEFEPPARELFEQHYLQQCTRSTTVYDGIRETLDQLKGGGVLLSVATNAPSLFAHRMLSHLEILACFDLVIGGRDVANLKPHPDMLHTILNEYGFEKERDLALMVGDNNKDMEAAARAGIKGIFATWGFSPHGQAATIIDHPQTIFDLLDIC
jgi:phosphoglycolate phosphatase